MKILLSKNFYIALLIVMIVATVAFLIMTNWKLSRNGVSGSRASGPYITPDTRQSQPVGEETNPVILVELSDQNNSGESGVATLVDFDGKAQVTMDLAGVFARSEPAHIHSGSCLELGAVKYPLASVERGFSDTTLEVSVEELLAQLPLAINVHKSAEEAGVYVACGDIPRKR